LIYGCYYAPLAQVIMSIPLNTIRKTDVSINNQIEDMLTIIASHTMLCEIQLKNRDIFP